MRPFVRLLRSLLLLMLLLVCCWPAPQLGAQFPDLVPATANVPKSDVTLLRKGNVVRAFRPSANTDLARGVALRAAVAAATSGDTVQLGPGTFELVTPTVNLPDGVNLRGAGMYATIIFGDLYTEVFYLNGVNQVEGVTFRVNDSNSTHEPLLIQTTGNASLVNVRSETVGTGSAACLWIQPGGIVRTTNCLFKGRVRNIGGTITDSNSRIDASGFAGGNNCFEEAGTSTAARSYFYGTHFVNDGQANGPICTLSGRGSALFKDAHFQLTGGAAAAAIDMPTSAFARTFDFINCKIEVASGAGGVRSAGASTVTSLVSGQISGSSTFDLIRTSGTLNVAHLQYDTTKTSGTITKLDTLPIKVSLGAASGSGDGYLSSADWTTFNGKQAAFGNQSANQVFSGPTSGGAAAPTFRVPVEADAPNTINWAGLIRLTGAKYKRLSIGTPTGGGTPDDIYTVPAGKRLLVNRIMLHNRNAASSTATLFAKISGTSYPVGTASASIAQSGMGGNYAICGYIYEPGEIVQIATSQTTCNVWLTGVEYDNTCPLKSAKLLSLDSGANTLYTVPASTSALLLDVAMNPYGNGIATLSCMFYFNNSGGNRAVSANHVPSGGSVGVANQFFVNPALGASATTRNLIVAAATLDAGDFINFTTDANTATQYVWVNVVEKANP